MVKRLPVALCHFHEFFSRGFIRPNGPGIAEVGRANDTNVAQNYEYGGYEYVKFTDGTYICTEYREHSNWVETGFHRPWNFFREAIFGLPPRWVLAPTTFTLGDITVCRLHELPYTATGLHGKEAKARGDGEDKLGNIWRCTLFTSGEIWGHRGDFDENGLPITLFCKQNLPGGRS